MKKPGYFKNGCVVENIESTEKFCAIRELLSKAPIASTMHNITQIEKAVIDREKIYTTGLGKGIAIAHGKTSGIKDLVILLGVSRNGIDFESVDGRPVHLLFLIANSPDHCEEYLFALSTLARVLRNESFCDKLLVQADPHQVEDMMAMQFHRATCRKN
ncbi:MAG: PTS sugar transporter subunit IIA [Spirochaetales bacterium]|nr:PTS sugar transporter subunit IIA [Spirochaetales bacterium]